jgi:polyisoprenoid-binding protein YceI
MATQVDIPGYVAGTWVIDAARSAVSFRIRQAGISTVRGSFGAVEGTIVTAADPRDSTVRAVIRTASIDTKNTRRDEHLRTKDYLDAEPYPTITFVSTGVRTSADGVLVDGELTIKDRTRPVTLAVTVDGFAAGQVRLSATTDIDRAGFGVTCGPAGPFLGKKVAITLRIEAGRQG